MKLDLGNKRHCPRDQCDIDTYDFGKVRAWLLHRYIASQELTNEMQPSVGSLVTKIGILCNEEQQDNFGVTSVLPMPQMRMWSELLFDVYPLAKVQETHHALLPGQTPG